MSLPVYGYGTEATMHGRDPVADSYYVTKADDPSGETFASITVAGQANFTNGPIIMGPTAPAQVVLIDNSGVELKIVETDGAGAIFCAAPGPGTPLTPQLAFDPATARIRAVDAAGKVEMSGGLLTVQAAGANDRAIVNIIDASGYYMRSRTLAGVCSHFMTAPDGLTIVSPTIQFDGIGNALNFYTNALTASIADAGAGRYVEGETFGTEPNDTTTPISVPEATTTTIATLPTSLGKTGAIQLYKVLFGGPTLSSIGGPRTYACDVSLFCTSPSGGVLNIDVLPAYLPVGWTLSISTNTLQLTTAAGAGTQPVYSSWIALGHNV